MVCGKPASTAAGVCARACSHLPAACAHLLLLHCLHARQACMHVRGQCKTIELFVRNLDCCWSVQEGGCRVNNAWRAGNLISLAGRVSECNIAGRGARGATRSPC